MLTRRHLRIKVMQSLYSFLQDREGNLVKEVNFFKNSYLNTFSLYLTLLAFLKSIYEYGKNQTNLQKELRSKTVKPNLGKLVQNKILSFIARHPLLIQHIKKRKIKFWELNFDYIKTNFKILLESQKFQLYQVTAGPSGLVKFLRG